MRELAERRPGRGDDGRGAGHRLEHRQPEALVERDVGDARGPAVEPGELLVVDALEPPDAVALDADVAPALGADEAQLEAVEPRPAEALDEPRQVLPRLERRDREDVRAVRARPVGG